MKTLILLLSFLSSGANAATGFHEVTCMSADLKTPLWVREYYVESEDPFKSTLR